MTFGPDPELARISDLDKYKSILDKFQSAGYNEVDTAHAYCGTRQQDFTRQAGWKERGLKLATKFYPSEQHGGHDAANIRAKLEWNLEQLGTDSVDIFYLHAADRKTPFKETLEEVNKLYTEGKFKELGLSNFTAYEVAEVVTLCDAKGWVKPTIYQGMYNAISESFTVTLELTQARNLESELIVACHRYGLQVVIYNPIAGGLFSGKIKSVDQVPDDESRFGSKNKHNAPAYRARYFRNSTFEALNIIEEASKKAGLTLIETALRWVIHHSALNVGEVGSKGDGVIIGVSSQEQLENNLKDLEKGPLPQEVVDAIDTAWLHVKAQAPVYWHGELKYGYNQTEQFEQ